MTHRILRRLLLLIVGIALFCLSVKLVGGHSPWEMVGAAVLFFAGPAMVVVAIAPRQEARRE